MHNDIIVSNCSVIITASELAIGMEVATVNKP